jgi:hypothetical protein
MQTKHKDIMRIAKRILWKQMEGNAIRFFPQGLAVHSGVWLMSLRAA